MVAVPLLDADRRDFRADRLNAMRKTYLPGAVARGDDHPSRCLEPIQLTTQWSR